MPLYATGKINPAILHLSVIYRKDSAKTFLTL
jgi:hypothetical protein